MESRVIRAGNAALAYDVQGTGPHALLAFHGAGQNKFVFHHLPPGFATTYRIYSFDLFFHGESQWNAGHPLSKQEWTAVVRQFLETEKIGHFSVLGYSIGARFALATVEAFPEAITACFLVAPDGLITSPWFGLATGSQIGRNVFRGLMARPERMHRLLQIAGRTGILDSIAARVIAHQLDSPEKRERIYRTWTAFRLLTFDLPALQKVFDHHDVNLTVFLATHDRIIPATRVQKLLKRLKTAHLEMVNANHRRILNDALLHIAGSKS